MNQDLKARLGGLLALVVAGVIGWWAIWTPWQDALHHQAQISYDLKAFVTTPALVVAGLFFLIFGNSVPYRDVEKQSLTPAGWILVIVIGVAALAGWWWFHTQIASQGYTRP